MTDKHDPQVTQLLAERANAVSYGQATRIAAVDKQLAGFGVKAEASKERRAAAETAEGSGEAKSKPPQGRSSKPQSKTD